MTRHQLTVFAAGCLLALAARQARADDLQDGISEAGEESIAADHEMGGKDVNVKFIVNSAIAEAQRGQRKGAKKDPKRTIHVNDGTGDTNENSVVVGPGSQVDTVINVVNEK